MLDIIARKEINEIRIEPKQQQQFETYVYMFIYMITDI